MFPATDRVGQTYGALTVIERVGSHHVPSKTNAKWRCRCTCGAVVERSSKGLVDSTRRGCRISCSKCKTTARRTA